MDLMPVASPVRAPSPPAAAVAGEANGFATCLEDFDSAPERVVGKSESVRDGAEPAEETPEVEGGLAWLFPLPDASPAAAPAAASDLPLPGVSGATAVTDEAVLESQRAGASPEPADLLPDAVSRLPEAAGPMPVVVVSAPASPAAAVAVSSAAPTVATPAPETLQTLAMSEAASGLAERVSQMLEREVWTVSLRLDPPQLGEVEVQLAIRDQQVALSLSSSDAQARMLLAQSLPELSAQLASRGLQLLGADVGDPSSSRDRTPQQRLARRAAVVESGAVGAGGDQRRNPAALMDGYA